MDEEVKTSIREKFAVVVAAGSDLIDAYEKKDRYDEQFSVGVCDIVADGMDRDTALMAFRKTDRGNELTDLCRIAARDDLKARVRYEQAICALRAQLILAEEVV